MLSLKRGHLFIFLLMQGAQGTWHREKIFLFHKWKNANIIFLQETHSMAEEAIIY